MVSRLAVGQRGLGQGECSEGKWVFALQKDVTSKSISKDQDVSHSMQLAGSTVALASDCVFCSCQRYLVAESERS